jgi:hypothetical protein
MKDPTPSEFEDARVLLHGQGIDLLFGVSMWTLFKKSNIEKFPQLLDGLQIPAARLYLSHVLLTLCKTAETYKRYKYLLREPVKASLKAITEEVEKRRIPQFRNKVIGHIWDKDIGRPLSPKVVDQRIAEIIPDKVQFSLWILNTADANDPATVVGQLKAAAAALKLEVERRKIE